MNSRILLVDDDENLLAALRRQLRRQFEITTACGAREGLTAISADGPYSVIMSDYRMPGMDGIAFLARARECSPTSIRVLMTAYADAQTAIEAVNQGHVFSLLAKPVTPEQVTSALEGALAQYRLRTSERDLLEKTVHGSIQMLTDVLALISPITFSRSVRVKACVVEIARHLKMTDTWPLECAAMLCQVGCVSLAPDTALKMRVGEMLTEEEIRAVEAHPRLTAEMLRRIPHLEDAAAMIERQTLPWSAVVGDGGVTPDKVAWGAQILHVALDFDERVMHGQTPTDACRAMRALKTEYAPEIVAAITTLSRNYRAEDELTVNVRNLRPGMVLAEDVRARDGLLLVAKGQHVTMAVLHRLRNFAQGIGVVEPFRVKPASEPARAAVESA